MHLEKRVLVTGGAGFLGSFLCERLLADGVVVLCVDNFFTGARRNIEHLIDRPRFELVRHDVTFPLYGEVDEIFNLACSASPVQYKHDPVQTTKTSVHGAINMLGLAKRLRARILQASTSEVYGDPLVHPQKEDYWGSVNPIGAHSCYDEGKRCAETLFFDYWRQHKLSIKVARILNTYGPRMRNNVSLNTEIVNQLETHGATTVERVTEWLKPALDDAIKEALEMAVYRTTRESRDRAEGSLDMLLSGRGMPDISDQRPLRTEAELAERMRRMGFPEDSVVYYLQIFRDRQAAKKAKEK